jgi:diadenosine tetraphosphate (Ap4A) HIT family hydrolase
MPPRRGRVARSRGILTLCLGGEAVNATAEKFGYPDNLLAEFDHWLVLLRPAQVTLGSLVLVCTDAASRFGAISAAAGTELVTAVSRIEKALSGAFDYDRINYLMLMMVDPDVHFHVLPRYAGERRFGAETFRDPFWPGPPDVKRALEVPPAVFAALREELRERFA